jgi:hypothetical protein
MPETTTPPTAATCQRILYGSGWHYPEHACGNRAKWTITYDRYMGAAAEPRTQRVTDAICGRCKMLVSRSYQVRYGNTKFAPADPNGCPRCATPMDGMSPHRRCAPCGYDEFNVLAREAEACLENKRRAVRHTQRQFDEGSVRTICAVITNALDALRSSLSQWDSGEWAADQAREAIKVAVAEVVALQEVNLEAKVSTTT